MKFKVIGRSNAITPEPDTAFLEIDHWNDYSIITMFRLVYIGINGERNDIGAIKIGFKGQTEEKATYEVLDKEFPYLGDNYFSLGQDIKFYRRLSELPNGKGIDIAKALCDIVLDPGIIKDIKDEKTLRISLLRDISLGVVLGQYHRTLTGAPDRTDFNFRFTRSETEELGAVSIDFSIKVDSTPSTNIHAIIGRNGVGKTTLLNGMIRAITEKGNESKFFNLQSFQPIPIHPNYFSSLVSVSFSAFDPFDPPKEQSDPSKGTCYFYIGLKDPAQQHRHRTIPELRADCTRALIGCFRNEGKSKRWQDAIMKLGSDEHFDRMKLTQLQDVFSAMLARSAFQSDSDEFFSEYYSEIDKYLSRMSSGHAIVLLTITRLVDTVQEKTLVLLDEPESHLHPPLLSAFVRALADLLLHQNAVALVATHSPVVLQEIPMLCVWKAHRVEKEVTFKRPKLETFAENVGMLTSEVFGLEVARSGFHDMLASEVKNGASFDEVILKYRDQLGIEGRAILLALIANTAGGQSK
ncbi:AAA family ATPase [Duganella sp. CY15W]|uniref:AAA family ATPase n=1 Tax=Duganella sp. CY15W TaxID=2692172 RepID=UPI00136CC9AC|nr:AAA family ATPase [Duganella sp. CY15W]MYM29300.1 AAA family ATPase [Duganella sp. CY15W]